MRLERLYPNSTIVCVGTGPSLTRTDVDRCRGAGPVIAVNDAFKLAPWADVLYACDAKWWEYHQGVPSFVGRKLGLQQPAERWGVEIVPIDRPDGLSLNPADGICTGGTGGHSGYQAVNVAVQLGAKRIVLLGYDLQRGPNDEAHFFGEHPSLLKEQSPFDQFVAVYTTMLMPLQEAGVEVVNCTRRTALTVFPRVALEDVLAEVAA